MGLEKFNDRDWRLSSLYYIVTKQGKKKLFKPNKIQNLINQNKSNRKMILKSRQVGVSTNELIKQLDFTLFNSNVTSCILAHEQDAIEKLFRIVRRAYEFMDDSIKPKLAKGGGSKYEMYFPSINSRIFCDLESRSNTINWLHISEIAFVEDMSRILATVEAVPTEGIITQESTPNGMNDFYEEWMSQDSNYQKLFFPWYFHDDYKVTNHGLTQKDLTDDEKRLQKYGLSKYKVDINVDQIAFRRFKQRELKAMFKQEYPEDDASCFLTSGENPFELTKIKPLFDNAPKPIEIIDGIKIYEKKNEKDIYILGADPAEGVDGDYSAAHVFKVSNREQVASFRSNNIKPSEFADVLIKMADMYSTGYPPILLGVERNNHGHAVLLKLDETHGYANLFRTRRENKKTEVEEIKLGWQTDRITRPLMIDMFIEGVENGSIILNDRDTLGECLTLTNNNGKIEAQDTKHDDLFIAACIAVQMCIEESGLEAYSDIKSKILI